MQVYWLIYGSEDTVMILPETHYKQNRNLSTKFKNKEAAKETDIVPALLKEMAQKDSREVYWRAFEVVAVKARTKDRSSEEPTRRGAGFLWLSARPVPQSSR